MKKPRTLFATTILVAAASVYSAFAQPIPQFSTTSLNIGIHLIKAEVASNEVEREYGLMFREKMAANEGMLFIFEKPQVVCMWMKNTLLPLSVAFIDNNGKIINIENMMAQTTDSHCSKKPAQFALEMNQGWFKTKSIQPDTPIEGLPHIN